MLPRILMAAVAGYLLGSLPFGWLVARARGVDIFQVGSRSSGATNVRRHVGAAASNAVFALDAVKGAMAAGWPLLAQFAPPLLCGVAGLGAALVGHSFSCFTGFRGGKGVATGAGGFLVLVPLVTFIAAVVWTLAFLLTRYVSLASILSAVTIPVAAVLLPRDAVLIGRHVLAEDAQVRIIVIAGISVALFVIYRHRANISRLLAGTESKWRRKAREGSA